jgi:putative ABC transport system permease protein
MDRSYYYATLLGLCKVLGASMNQILQLIAKGFVQLIVVALLLAAPLTWYLSKDWLAEFADRIAFPWWTTLLSGLAVMLIAFLTISAQFIRAALSNPVHAIRND